MKKEELVEWVDIMDKFVYGVVDVAEYPEKEPRYQIVKMREDSKEEIRFHWGASCSGWFPLKTFASKELAERFITLEKKRRG